MRLQYGYGMANDRWKGMRFIRAAVGRGVTFFDVAESYGSFTNEELVGEALGPIRDRVVTGTKFGWNIALRTVERRARLNSRPEHIKVATEDMLEWVKTDCIDPLYRHRVDPEVAIEDVAGAINDFIQQGEVKHFGLSEAGVQTLRWGYEIQPVAGIRSEYSIRTCDPKVAVVLLCAELGIGFVLWSSPAQGFLTRKIDSSTTFDSFDLRASFPCFTREAQGANLTLVALSKQMARRKKAPPAQVPLAWLLAQKPWIAPIPGTRKPYRLEESIGAAGVDLTPDDLRDVKTSFAGITVEGARLPARDSQVLESLTSRLCRASLTSGPGLQVPAIRTGDEALRLNVSTSRSEQDATEEGTTMRSLLTIAISFCVLVSGALGQTSTNRQSIRTTRNGSRPARPKSAEHFTSVVGVEGRFEAEVPARMYGATIAFEPGTRTYGHVYPLGQTLVVPAGTGRVQQWGEPAHENRPGGVVQITPGMKKHRHGDSPDGPMTYVALAERPDDGPSTEKTEAISEEQYAEKLARPAAPPADPDGEVDQLSRVHQLMSDIAPEQPADLTDDVLCGQVWASTEPYPSDWRLVRQCIHRAEPSRPASSPPPRARDNVTEEELIETITPWCLYAVWPSKVTAIAGARKVFPERGITKNIFEEEPYETYEEGNSRTIHSHY